MKAKKWHIYLAKKPRGFVWREFLLIIEANKIVYKIHCTASKARETRLKYSLPIYYFANVQELNTTCESRR